MILAKVYSSQTFEPESSDGMSLSNWSVLSLEGSKIAVHILDPAMKLTSDHVLVCQAERFFRCLHRQVVDKMKALLSYMGNSFCKYRDPDIII
jgi:uncharacterized protein (DUF488 family)